MRFLHEIENSNEQQLYKKVSRKIAKLERKSKKYNPTTDMIGYQMGYNPIIEDVEWHGDEFKIRFLIRCFYNQFINKDTKIVYGLKWSRLDGRASNDGNYYYMDDQDYLYDFCYFVQDKEIQDEYEFFGYVKDFMRYYFGKIKMIERDQMNSLLVDHDGKVLKPIKEHSIKDFEGKGNALCSEYAAMAQNILRLFDFESYLVIGNLKTDNNHGESHAYNLITFKETYTGELKHAVLDFLNGVNIYDYNYQKISDEPFIGYIDALDQEFANRLVEGEEHLVFDEYGFYVLGDTVSKIALKNKTRDYYIDKVIRPDFSVNKSKILTRNN